MSMMNKILKGFYEKSRFSYFTVLKLFFLMPLLFEDSLVYFWLTSQIVAGPYTSRILKSSLRKFHFYE